MGHNGGSCLERCAEFRYAEVLGVPREENQDYSQTITSVSGISCGILHCQCVVGCGVRRTAAFQRLDCASSGQNNPGICKFPHHAKNLHKLASVRIKKYAYRAPSVICFS